MKRIFILSILIISLLAIPCCEKESPSEYFKGAVSTVHPLATEIGADVLVRGGSAADCAVAVGFALAVVYPQAGNIGGGGFANIYIKDSALITTLDFREKAPLFAKEDMYLDTAGNLIENASTYGYKAVAVPGTVAGLLALHRRFGLLPLEDLIQPAIELARRGFKIDSVLAADLQYHRLALAQSPYTRNIFFRSGNPLAAGDRLIQRDLAETLERIKQFGRNGFYSGKTAELLVNDITENGGIITRVDLREYEPLWRQPVSFEFEDYRIFSMGPPSSGGILLAQIFNMLKQFDLPDKDPYDPMFVHLFAEVCKRAYADRAEYLGDIDFVQIPLRHLISEEYAENRLENFDPMRAVPSDSIGPGVIMKNSESTTHFSIIDRDGNAIALTYTINASFGAKVMADGLGFFLNNEMDDFSAKPGEPNIYGLVGGYANSIQPQKRPLSSMSPTLVFKGEDLIMVTGSPGGSKIITTVALSILNYLEFDRPAQEAVKHPRFHHQHLPDTIFYEYGAITDKDLAKLQSMGHNLQLTSEYGCLNIIARKKSTAEWEAAADPRRGGTATVLY